MRIAPQYTRVEWLCLCCGETVIREMLRGKPEPGICKENSTQTEEKPHKWTPNLLLEAEKKEY